MELPEDVLQIIKEYSQPMTKQDWRTLHRMPFEIFKMNCYTITEKKWIIMRHTNHYCIFSGANYLRMFMR